MARTFSTTKRFLSRDEKKKIVNSHKKMNLPLPNNHTYQSFMNSDIENEFVTMICEKCLDKEEIELDFINAYLDHYKDLDYPEGFCSKCGGRQIPLDIYLEENK